MKTLLINFLLVGYTLAFVKNRGIRDDFSRKALEFLSGRDKEAARVEMMPSPGCEEGDMDLSPEQVETYNAMREVTDENKERVRRDVEALFRVWPNRTLVYRFDETVRNSVKLVFKRAVDTYAEVTGVTFLEALDDYTGSIHPLNVYGHNKGCSSTVGYSDTSGGRMNLEAVKCEVLGTILHELGHALGRFHEQSRSDRDDHVTVLDENILPGFEHNFRKADRPIFAPYDIQSIMHYSPDAYSVDHISETIIPHDAKDKQKMGRQQRLSRLDVFTVNYAYGVYDVCPDDLWNRCQRGGVPDKHCECDCLPQFEGPYCEIFINQTECSSIYQLEDSGIIQSPGYPGMYASNTKCDYVIECAADEVIQLDFSEFDIEGYGCFFDKLSMMTGNLVSEVYPDEYCGDDLHGQRVISERNVAVMTFESDSRFNYPGYEIYYHCIPLDYILN